MEWREIPNLKGYMVSDEGEVMNPSGDILDIRPNKKGYKVITVRLPVHQAVLLAFEGPPTAGNVLTRHLDGNSINNKRDNLKWGTHKENTCDAIKHGTHVCGLSSPFKGEASSQSKLTEEQVVTIKVRAQSGDEKIKDIAKDYPVAYSTVCKIARGQDWKHVTV